MEAFESFCAVALEAEGLVVSSGVKFPVALKTRKAAYSEIQTHGYEIDLVGARADLLVLATVKSYFGSRGVVAEHVTGETSDHTASRRYLLLNHPSIRRKVVNEATRLYGYGADQVELRLYVGRFAAPIRGTHEKRIRAWAKMKRVGRGRSRSLALQTSLAVCGRLLRKSSTATTRYS